jgi:hypothetical protein
MKAKSLFKSITKHNVFLFFQKDRLLHFIVPLCLFLFVLILYSLTLPNVNTGYADSDEFLTAAKVFGVPHPPGYPLYTVLSAVFGRLPLPLTFAGKVNFLSTVLHSLTVVLIYFSGLLLLGQVIKDRFILAAASLIGALSLCLMFSFWFYGLFAEVFPLDNFLAALSLLILLIWSKKYKTVKVNKKKKTDPFQNVLIAGVFVFGLGLSNQQVIILLFPMFAFWVFFTRPRILLDWALLFKLILAFCLGTLLPYSYVFIAAHHLPIINWENVHDLNGLYRLITRRIYAEAAPTGVAYTGSSFSHAQTVKGIQLLTDYLVENYGKVWLAISIAGLVYLGIKRQWKILGLLILGLIGGGIFFTLYGQINVAPDHPYYNVVLGVHQRFYLLIALFVSLLVTTGMAGIFELLKRFSAKVVFISVGMMIIFIAFNTVSEFKEIKSNDFNLGHTFAVTLLKTLPKNAVLLCFSEHSCFTASYVQSTENIRPDVLIIAADYSQMPIEQIRIKYPGLIKTTANRVSPKRAIILNRDLIRWQISKRPIYVAGVSTDPGVLSAMGLDGDPFYLVPEGCAMRVSKTFTIPTKPNTCLPVENEFLHSHIISRTPIAYMFNGYLLYQRYFNGLLFSERLCNKAALDEFARGVVLDPGYKKLKEMIKNVEDVPRIDECQGTVGEVKLADVLKKEDQSENKNDIQNAIYFQAEATLIKPQDLDLRFKLAKMYVIIGAYENALIEYSDIVALAPKNLKAFQHMYRVQQAMELGTQINIKTLD